MSKFRIFYILSLVMLGVLLVFTVFRPMVIDKEYSQVQRQLLEKEDQWIIELHIFNREGKDTNYTINVLVDEELCTESIVIGSGEIFKYIHHIYKDGLKRGEVSVAVYKEGEDTPFKQVTYYLK